MRAPSGRVGGSAPPPSLLPAEGDAPAEEPVQPEPSKPEDPLAAVERLIDGLGLASLVFNPPREMLMEERRVVDLLLSPEKSVEFLKSQLPEADRATAESAEGVKVGARMEAVLTGAGFAVESLSPPEQIVSRSQPTRWSWAVTPSAPGSQLLRLTLSAKIQVEGHDTPFVVRTFDRSISVRVTVGQRVAGFVTANWTWLWATILVPAVGYAWKRIKRRRKKDKS